MINVGGSAPSRTAVPDDPARRSLWKDTAEPALVMGMPRWKRGFVRPFIATADIVYRVVSPAAVAEAQRQHRRLYVWAAREPAWLADVAAAAGVSVTRIEDGFLRSVGLGSNFVPALSLVLDPVGIYFDPTRESGLERLLNRPDFATPEILAAARRLRARLVETGLTKYNLGRDRPSAVPNPRRERRRVILIPGQVEDDASIRRGSLAVARNLDLMAAVRHVAPDAVLLYKPHPEIEAGNRRGAVLANAARRYVDHILTGWNAGAALAIADEVHTMTSLMGFEALLRGIPVTTYGLPFYAGLGLTADRRSWPRPRRPVDLDTLVAAALLCYPRYRDPARDRAVDAFGALDILARRCAAAPPPARAGWARALRWVTLTTGFSV